MTNLTPDEFRAIILESVEYAMKKKQDTSQTGLGTKALTDGLNDMFDELNKVKRELTSLKEHVKLLSKEIDALNFSVRRNQQDAICKADVPQDVIKKPRTGTATTSDGIYFKDVNPDR